MATYQLINKPRLQIGIDLVTVRITIYITFSKPLITPRSNLIINKVPNKHRYKIKQRTESIYASEIPQNA